MPSEYVCDHVLQDIRYALRALRSSPGFSAIAILSLALGIRANTAIFSLINAVIFKTLPVSHPEQLVELRMKTEDGLSFTNPVWEQVRDRQDVFSGAFACSPTRLNLAMGGEIRNANAVACVCRFSDRSSLDVYEPNWLSVVQLGAATHQSDRRQLQHRALSSDIGRYARTVRA